MSHDDLWQAYSEQGEPVGNGLTKDEAARGALHGASHVWLWRGTGKKSEILLQKRAEGKKTWPGHLDISAAGHIDVGETPLMAALRETKEEVGLTIPSEKMRLLFVYKQWFEARAGLIEYEFQWVFGVRVDNDLDFRHDDGEVDSMHWLPKVDFLKLTKHQLEHFKIVPHDQLYFTNLLAWID